MRRVYEFECVHTVTYAEHCVGHKGRGSVLYSVYEQAHNTLSAVACSQLRPKGFLASKKNCAQKNLEPNSIFGNGFLEIEKLVLRFH